ncbi:ABC transporter ATP-binding protein [Actinacidiphila acidipaludis]|uniref:ABC transporter ATP-binding protein n=1 Tax=Actinacidiphila acidipaludis TaxID=2873382 RepID=A0ABS7PZP1_9ACTN|nr:ABC transporter ATP-binding protein [Streptomyces acidipaludis]MBY8876356.1 ABC transporter ATP-binding protein [Streptomyces acidipaludis]
MDKAKAPLGGATGVGPVPVIETSGLTKRFGDRAALSGLDLAVPGGCAFGLLGANGAGKTTLIRTVLGLTAATSGSVRVLGRPMPAARARVLARVGAVVEEPRFHGHLTGRENLRVAAAVRGREAGQRVGTLLERVGLAGRADERVAGYSLGMRQRLGIARCLLSDPLLLILDEPMNGLDPAGIIGMREMIRTLVGEGRTVVISSHLLDEVEKTCDAVAVIDRGRLIAQGPVPGLVGADEQVLVGCTEAARAMELLSAQDTVAGISVEGDGLLRVTPRPGCTAASLNRLLVRADICVGRLEPVRATLEERFLQILSNAGEEVR